MTWISKRKGNTWSEPKYLEVGGMYVSSTLSGTLYYTNTKDKPRSFIARSKYINEEYQKEETIPKPVFF